MMSMTDLSSPSLASSSWLEKADRSRWAPVCAMAPACSLAQPGHSPRSNLPSKSWNKILIIVYARYLISEIEEAAANNKYQFQFEI